MNAKNMKITTKLSIGFLVIIVVALLCVLSGYNAAVQVTEAADPVKYLNIYRNISFVYMALIVISCLGVAAMMTGTMKKAFAEVKKATTALAEGKIDVKMQWDFNDEYGEVIKDLQKVVDNIAEDAMVAQRVADGDLTVRVTPKSADDVMGNALKKMVEKNSHTLSNISQAAYQITLGSSQVASASEALAQGSTEQASAIQQITASMDDVANRTRQNAEQANEAESLMQETLTEVQVGNAEMQEMVKAMEEINVASENISKIIKVIDDIAFQTNILALNAAVEAARAGDAGKGFAVVAEEVRNLAAKSTDAAAETAEMIEDSIRKVNEGSAIAKNTAVALDKITAAVTRSEGIVNEIAKASNDQATAIVQIDKAIEQVSQVVQTNSATSEECAAASEELSDQANSMQSMVAVYRLNNYR